MERKGVGMGAGWERLMAGVGGSRGRGPNTVNSKDFF